MKAIKLDEEYRIETDIASWNLIYEKTHTEKNAKGNFKVSKTILYYPTLKSALEGYLDAYAKESKSVEQLLERIKEAESNIEKACASITKSDVR